MYKNFTEQTINVDGAATRYLLGPAAGQPALFVHGGAPGALPLAHGVHMWGDVVQTLDFQTPYLLDLPGCGASEAIAGPASLLTWIEHVEKFMRALELPPVHLVGYGSGGLLALLLAAKYPASVRCVSCIASPDAAPTGDSVNDLTLAFPPRPYWSAASQRWALERLAYGNAPVDPALLQACVAAAQAQGYAARAQGDDRTGPWAEAVLRAKIALFRTLRETGIPKPVQLIWANDDTRTTIDQGVYLYGLIAQKQAEARFHAVNRSGAHPFREQPALFRQYLRAFSDACVQEA